MGLFGGNRGQGVKPEYTGIQGQTSTGTLPVAIYWGANRGAPNLMDYTDFANHPHEQKTGKGLGGGSATSYTYSASVLMGLAEGEISGVGRVWKDKETYASYADLGMTLFTGTDTQAAWGYMVTAHPERALTYRGVAYLAVANYDLGGSAAIGNHNFEIFGLRYNTAPGSLDAEPEGVVLDFLTDPTFGVGFPLSMIDTASLDQADGSNSYGTYCRAMGFGLSPALVSQEAASDILERWCKLTNTAPVWTGYSLKLIPYGDETITGNGITYVPAVEPVAVLTMDDFVGGPGDPPFTISRSDPADARNSVTINFKNRANAYNVEPCERPDQNAVELYGLLPADAITASEICELAMADKVVTLLLQRSVYQLTTISYTLSWESCLLEPMDVVTLIVPGTTPGLEEEIVRITKVSENDDGNFELEAEEFAQGVASAAVYARQEIDNGGVDQNAAPGPVNDPVIIAMRSKVTDKDAELWAAVSGGDGTTGNPNWGGCFVWISFDDGTYQNIGEVSVPARQGKLTASLATYGGANPDAAHTLAVSLAMSASGDLESVSTDEAANAVTLAYVGGELLSYKTATLTGTRTYDLTSLYRGLFGTAAAAHSSGAAFARLDDNVFKYRIPDVYQGDTIFMKFQSFNIFGKNVEDLADCVAYSIDLDIVLAPPDKVVNLRLSSWSQDLILDWDEAALADSYIIDIYKADGTTLVTSKTSTVSTYTYTGVQARVDGAERSYKIVVTPVNGGGNGPASAVLAITNAAPPAPQNAQIYSGDYSGYAVCDAVVAADLSGYVLFYSSISGFNPAIQGTPVTSGVPAVTVNGLPSGTYYGRLAAFDLWSSDPALLNMGAQQTFSINVGNGQTPTGSGGGAGSSTAGGGHGYTGTVRGAIP